MGVHVDDIVLTAKTDEQLQEVKTALSKQFEIRHGKATLLPRNVSDTRSG